MLNKFWVLSLVLFVFHGWAQHQQSDYDKMLKEEYDGTVPLMQPKTLYEALQDGETIHILDAREQKEYEVSFIQGAEQVGFLFFRKGRVDDIEKTDKIVIYCTIGARSESIGERLLKDGYTNVYNLYGGIIQWKNEGYPLVDTSTNETEDVHVYSKKWGVWLRNGNPVD